MKNPRKLLWLLLPAAFGIVSVSIGFSAWQLNYIENNGGAASESLYSLTYHYEDASNQDKSELLTNELEYTSDLDLKVLPDWHGTFLGWKVGTSSVATGTTVFTNTMDHTVKDLWNDYSTKPNTQSIHLWVVWSN